MLPEREDEPLIANPSRVEHVEFLEARHRRRLSRVQINNHQIHAAFDGRRRSKELAIGRQLHSANLRRFPDFFDCQRFRSQGASGQVQGQHAGEHEFQHVDSKEKRSRYDSLKNRRNRSFSKRHRSQPSVVGRKVGPLMRGLVAQNDARVDIPLLHGRNDQKAALWL